MAQATRRHQLVYSDRDTEHRQLTQRERGARENEDHMQFQRIHHLHNPCNYVMHSLFPLLELVLRYQAATPRHATPRTTQHSAARRRLRQEAQAQPTLNHIWSKPTAISDSMRVS